MKGFKQKNPKNWIFPFPFCHTLPIDLEKCALGNLQVEKVVDLLSSKGMANLKFGEF